MRTYRNDGGPHILADGTVVPTGGHLATDDPDFLKKFPGKFTEAAAAPEPAAVGTDSDGADQDQAPAGMSSDSADQAPPEATDVTADFPTAAAHGLTVRKIKSAWWVYDEGDDEPAHEKGLLKKDVAKFIEDNYAD